MLGNTEERRAFIDDLVDKTREGLVDDVARLMELMLERDYAEAALYAFGLSENLSVISGGLAAEALARRMEDGKGLTGSD